MRIECCKCQKNKKGRVIDCFFFLGKMFVRIKCDKCKLHEDTLLYIPGIVY